MQSSYNNSDSFEENIVLKDQLVKTKIWFNYLLSRWKLIALFIIIGGIIGLTITTLRKPIYTAETTFVLEEGDSGGGLGQYAGLASMIGIDLGGSGGGVFKGDNILELYQSRKMIKETLLSEDFFDGKKELLINRYIKFNKLKDKWNNNDFTRDLIFTNQTKDLSRTHDSIITDIANEINKKHLAVTKPNSKLSIISVKFQSKDELFAKSFTLNIVKGVNQFYVETKTKKSAENLYVLQRQADSIKNILNIAILGVASAIDANPNFNPAFQSLRVPSQRKQIDVQANAAAYGEILKNLEIAKISFRKDQPLIQVIDEPVLPLSNNKISKLIGFLFGSIISLIFVSIYLILSKIHL
ncbi:MAG: Wzz/FepE/Etk N-terminal domain-containing protein [Flavobacterium sp.]|jgi:hypothetical protein|nr:Wzz/FepE/Etk N-terminal domain-containing protein [Flavobacterium sp.]